eukprot:CAMPEP_0119098136 /NCGR_PEP_ID=MMETSP1178-20130426/184413_1 /TAXON_ID=33656 /ORGANISM="unid sp, Strain CCMP2000" /LENGTH=114 /DNA_ID=CAMNT_0007082109 /DNA_START=581 /DNA_END=925 /DNA_ORIENTATION=-
MRIFAAVRPSPVRKSPTSPADSTTPATVWLAPGARLPPFPEPPKDEELFLTPAAFLRAAIITIVSGAERSCTKPTGAVVGAKALAVDAITAATRKTDDLIDESSVGNLLLLVGV